jgi:beta-aspartyl-peptidase (threonine type)
MFAIALHGGAGISSKDSYSKEELDAYRADLKEAISVGLDRLRDGASAREAVIATVCKLEDSPLFNAGRGSVLNAEGEIEMDASIMCGETLKAGGVSNLRKIKNPILAANTVAEVTSHRLLSGTKAEDFLTPHELETATPDYFVTDKRYKQYQAFLKDRRVRLEHDSRYSTVGAVALDSRGHLAAATSTGGLIGKIPGRVSDSAIIGAGTYADNRSCAISTTGMGDEFIRHCAAFQVHSRILWMKQSLRQAAVATLENVASTEGNGGMIVLGPQGQCEFHFDTNGMFRAYANSNGILEIGVFHEDCPASF